MTYEVQPRDADLDNIAALVTTVYGRALLAVSNLAELRAILGPTGTPSSATFLRGDGQWSGVPPVSSGVASVNGHSGDVNLTASDVSAQPVDSDLTAIAALSTTSFGRSLLALADAAALLSAAGAQAHDADLDAIAALTTTAFGRSVLTQADGAAVVSLIGAQPADSDLTAIAALTTTSTGRSLLAAANAAAIRTIADAQQLNANLTALAGQTGAADKISYWTAAGTLSLADFGSFARSVLQQTTSSAWRTALGVVIDTDVAAYSAKTKAISDLTWAADKGLYFTSASAPATFTLTTAGRALIDDADASAQRTTLGLGTLATTSPTGTPTAATYLDGTGAWSRAKSYATRVHARGAFR